MNSVTSSEVQTLENGEIRLRIGNFGGEMLSLYSHRSRLEYLWQRDGQHWDRSSPILFPIVGRIANGEYTYDDRIYRMQSPHGFAPNCYFHMQPTSRSSLTAVLTDTPELLEIYPFRFRLEVEYALHGMSVSVRFLVRNRGQKRMFFSLGAHPGFRIPLLEDETFEDFDVEFSNQEIPYRYRLAESLITGQKEPLSLENGGRLPLSHDLFTEDAIVLDSIRNQTVRIRSRRHHESISVTWDHFKYLGLWKPPAAEAAFLCVEPWFGLPSVHGTRQDYLDKKPGISVLEQGECFRAGYQIILHENEYLSQ